jgi:hypothetical protein
MHPHIELVRAELEEMATAVMGAAGGPETPFGTYFILPEEPESELARAVEREVFDEWFGNSPELLDAEYRDWEPASIFIVVLDHARRLPAGMARFTLPSQLGFKTVEDLRTVWGEEPAAVLERSSADWDLTKTWDAQTLAVSGDYRRNATGGLVSLGLLQAANRALILSGGRLFITVLDVHVLRTFNELLHDAYEVFPGIEPVSYLDSPLSVPCFVDHERYEPALLEVDPGLHRIIFDGVGIESVVREASYAPALRRAGVEPVPAAVVTPSTSS